MSTEIARVEFTQDQVALIKRTICVGATDDELALFLQQCRRTALDPFAKQIYGIKRKGKLTIQVGIDGFRLNAARSGLYDGQDGPFWCGPDGIWRDSWLAKGPPAAAKVIAYRQGVARGFVGVARFDEYAQMYDGALSDMWGRMGANMIAKCAEALALRKAFPQELSGLYAPEEMDQDESESEPAPQVKQLPAPKGDPYENTRARLRGAHSLADLGAVWNALPTDVQRACLADKDARKAELSKPPTPQHPETKSAIPEGEQSSDPTTPATSFPAPPAATPSAKVAGAPDVATSTPEPRTMPAAERRTGPPSFALSKEKLARVEAISRALDALDLVYGQVRDRTTPEAAAIADACGLPMIPLPRLAQLDDAALDRLRAHVERAGAA